MSRYGEVIAPRTVRFERLLPGPIERVWSYLTDPEKRGTWLAKGNMDLRVDGPVELIFHNNQLTGHDETAPPKYAKYGGVIHMAGHVVACEPPRLLTYTWNEREVGEASEVTFELAPQGKNVLLTLTHRKLSGRSDMLSVSGGWHAHLDVLVDRLEGRKPGPFWPAHAKLADEYESRIPAE